ncbi:MAG: ABC transporter ATP-binding protein [Acidimicrobiia bacterium]|nr:ABC transporter ATP-binding protein [Acidimicrobiia bacterium]
MTDELIRLLGVGRTFRSGDIEVRALRDADLEVRRGEYLSIVGPSGSGKSTLLNIIALLDRHTSGTYRFEGTDVTELSEGARTGLRAHRIGFVFQSFHLLAHRTVTENVIMSMLYNSVPPRERRARARAALDRVGLDHRAGFRPGRLSGGERQRVAIARAIATRPAILICDEPTGNLDSASTESVLELFDDLRSDGLTLLVVTHDDAVSARAERIVRMHDGRLSEPVAV